MTLTNTPTARTTRTSFFDTTTNLWSDAFLVGRGGDFNDNDESNNHHTDDYNNNTDDDDVVGAFLVGTGG